MNSRVANSVLSHLLRHRLDVSRRCFSTATSTPSIVFRSIVNDRCSPFGITSWQRHFSSSSSALSKEEQTEEKSITGPTNRDVGARQDSSLAVSSYWGIMPPKITREDGSVWPWNCFRPWETYTADLSIDLSKHHVPKTFLDRVAHRTVKLLRIPTDVFFQMCLPFLSMADESCLFPHGRNICQWERLTLENVKRPIRSRTRRYGCRAMMLETVAAVPGMVGGMLLHLKSLRRFEQTGGWIRALLEEAENERMHLMTMVEVVQPRWYERLLVLAVQGVFFNAYFGLYLLSPKLAHRVVGYLEEEAIHSYTEFLKEIDSGAIPDVPAPAIAIDYWRLPSDATLKDVIVVIRADEAHHRDVNHFASDIRFQGKELKETPAPIGYH